MRRQTHRTCFFFTLPLPFFFFFLALTFSLHLRSDSLCSRSLGREFNSLWEMRIWRLGRRGVWWRWRGRCLSVPRLHRLQRISVIFLIEAYVRYIQNTECNRNPDYIRMREAREVVKKRKKKKKQKKNVWGCGGGTSLHTCCLCELVSFHP